MIHLRSRPRDRSQLQAGSAHPRLRENRCSCWVKVGTAHASLAPTGTNYGKPWFFIYLRDGRVSGFHFALR
jgi:hypothetical protein